MSELTAGDRVQTPLGKGIVREVRNNGRLLVDVQGRALVLRVSEVSAIEPASRRPARVDTDGAGEPTTARGSAAAEIDLHGLTVAEALVRTESALNDALLANLPELRLIHGRSGGRIRAALHQRLREVTAVRGFHLDPGNAGVTVVRL